MEGELVERIGKPSLDGRDCRGQIGGSCSRMSRGSTCSVLPASKLASSSIVMWIAAARLGRIHACGEAVPASQRTIVERSTPSRSASASWVRPTAWRRSASRCRLRAMSRSPTFLTASWPQRQPGHAHQRLMDASPSHQICSGNTVVGSVEWSSAFHTAKGHDRWCRTHSFLPPQEMCG